MSTLALPGGLEEKGGSRIHVTATKKGDTAWYAVGALIIALLLLAYLMLKAYGLIPEGSHNAMLTGDMLNIFSASAFLIASFLALRRARNLKIGAGILAFTISAQLYFIAEVCRTALDLTSNGKAPSHSMADVFFITAHATFIIALLLMTKGLTGKARAGRPAIATAAMGSALLAGILYYLTQGPSPNIASIPPVMEIPYLALDLISLVIVVLLFAASLNRGVAQAHVILAAGISLASISSIMLASGAAGLYSGGSIAGFLLAGGYMLFAIGVWRYVGLAKSDILDDRLYRLEKKAIARK